MTVNIEVFEDWGPALGSPARGTNRTAITNANLKTYSDPDQHYFLNDLRRPYALDLNSPLHTVTHTRHISWKLSGVYNKVKNIRIVIPKPTGNQFKLFYGLRSTYIQPATAQDLFGLNNGVFDGTLIPITDAITIYPRISTVGPEAADSRAVSYGPSQPLFTEYLVLQAMAHPSAYDDVGNFGSETISLQFDELE